MLIVAQLLKQDAPVYPKLPADIPGKTSHALSVYERVMKPLWKTEEDRLFPFIAGRNASIDQLIFILQDDQTELTTRFERLAAEVNQVFAMNEIGHLLERHVRMEERELFQQVQVALDETEMSALNEHLQA